VVNVTETLLTMGEWDRAHELHQETAIRGVSDSLYVAAAIGLLAGLRGDAEAARAAADRIAGVVTEDLQDQALILLAQAVAAHAAGDHAKTLEDARGVVAFAPALGIRWDTIRWAWPLAARAARSLGDLEALRDLVRTVDDYPIGHVPPVLRAAADLARIDIGAVEPDAVEATYERAIGMLRDLPSPYHVAWSLLHRGRDEDLAEAAAIAERLGAAPLAAAVDAGRSAKRDVGDPSNTETVTLGR
jgi:hypothetical protein